MIQAINTMQDVVVFINQIAEETKDGNPFEEICRSKQSPDSTCRYTEQEAILRDKLMDRCFEVCSAQSQNFIYLSLVLMDEARHNQFTFKAHP
jgi:hypothetical protein